MISRIRTYAGTMALFAALMLFVTPQRVFAESVFWNIASSRYWGVSNNWDPNGIPDLNDSVYIRVNNNPYDIRVANNWEARNINLEATNARLIVEHNKELLASDTVGVSGGELRLEDDATLTAKTLWAGGPGKVYGRRTWFNANIENYSEFVMDDCRTSWGYLKNYGTFIMINRNTGIYPSALCATTMNEGLFVAHKIDNDLYTFTNEPDGTLRIEANDSYGSAGIRLYTCDITNRGLMQLINTSAVARNVTVSNLPSSNGRVVNEAFGIISISGPGSHAISTNLSNAGLIQVGTTVALDGDTVINDGTGTISLIGGGITSNSTTFTNNGQITGAGGACTIDGVLNNNGNIYLSGGGLTASYNAVTNTGTIDVSGGNILIGGGSIDNYGDIDIGPGRNFSTNGITAVTLRNGSTLDGGGTINFNSQTTVTLEGPWSNGTSNVNLSDAIVRGSTWTNTANVVMTDPNTGRYPSHIDTRVLNQGTWRTRSRGNGICNFTNEPGGTLRVEAGDAYGSGEIRTAYLDIVNRGLMELTNTSAVARTVTVSNIPGNSAFTGGLVNEPSGILRADGLGSRTIDVILDNQGLFDIDTDVLLTKTGSNSGTMNLAAGTTTTILGPSFTNEVSGVIEGNGRLNVNASFIDNGTISPGNSFGTLEYIGNYAQGTTGILDLEIGGTTPGVTLDQFVLTGGTGTFGGTLRLSFVNGFAPIMGQEFDLISGTAIDNFSGVDIIGLEPGFDYDTSTTGGSFTMTALNDGVSVVPEPGTAILLGIAVLALAFRRKRGVALARRAEPG